MLRLYLTRLVLPILFVGAMLALPFVWLPDAAPPGGAAAPGKPDAPRTATPFQRTMTLGFALILVSVTAGGLMLFQITRRQSASWRRRFAPRRKAARAPKAPPGEPS